MSERIEKLIEDLQRRVSSLERITIGHRRLGPSHHEPTADEIREHSDKLVEIFEAAHRASQKEKQMVRAKFMVQEIRRHHYGNPGATTIILRPQYDENIEEDKRFAKATPTGEISMYVDNPPAQAFFELGKKYYLDFSPAD